MSRPWVGLCVLLLAAVACSEAGSSPDPYASPLRPFEGNLIYRMEVASPADTVAYSGNLFWLTVGPDALRYSATRSSGDSAVLAHDQILEYRNDSLIRTTLRHAEKQAEVVGRRVKRLLQVGPKRTDTRKPVGNWAARAYVLKETTPLSKIQVTYWLSEDYTVPTRLLRGVPIFSALPALPENRLPLAVESELQLMGLDSIRTVTAGFRLMTADLHPVSRAQFAIPTGYQVVYESASTSPAP